MEEEFLKWYEKNETRFHQGHFDDKEIAYSAWLKGSKESNQSETMDRVSSFERMIRWIRIDEQEPDVRRYLYLACTELVGPREDKYVIEGYKDGGRYYAFVDGETGGTEISEDSIDYWMYKNKPEHPDI